MTAEEKIAFLKEKGWSTWYSENYWVHRKTVVDETRQDHTNYGMTLDCAYEFETTDHKPWIGNYLGCRI